MGLMERYRNMSSLWTSTRTDKYRLLTVFEQMNSEFPEDIVRKKQHVAAAAWFNTLIGVLIVINSVLLGVEVDSVHSNKLEDRLVFFVMDFLFALAFFIEMLVRQNQLGWDYFMDAWNVFDYSLVVLNIADLVSSVSDSDSEALKLATTLRIVRLLRIVRFIKGLKMVYGLWLIIQGLLDALRTIFWIGVTLFIIIFILAVALTTLVGQSAYVRERWRYSDQYLGTVYRSMWTVLQIVTLDNWAEDIARPLMGVSPAAVVIVVITIVVCSFGMLNIIISVMLERIQTIAQESKDMTGRVLAQTEQALLMSMLDDFQAADTENAGELEYSAFRAMIRTESMSHKLLLLGIRCDEAENLFELMDADKSGSVSPEEFIGGAQKLKGPAKGQDMVQLICFAQKQCLRASRFLERLRTLNRRVDEIQERLNGVGRGIGSELRNRKQASSRNDDVWQRAAERQLVIGKLDLARRLDFPSLKPN